MRFRRSRQRPLLVLPIVVGFVQVVGTHAVARHHTGGSTRPLDALATVLLLAGPAMLLFRRRWPVPVCAGTAAVAGAYLLLRYPYGPIVLSVVIAYVSAVLADRRRAAWISLGALYVAHVVANSFTHALSWPFELGLLAWLLVVVVFAELMRTRIERRQQWRQARAEREARIADEQRLAIARELHDVLAHSISLINVQAGVALELIDDDPEQARTALRTIKETSKEALGEVRQVLGSLRTPTATTGAAATVTPAAPRSPAPDLERLDELVRQAAAAGLTVTVHREGTKRVLPSGVGLAAFRIVQEGLTNVLRHSSARVAEVTLDHRRADRLLLTLEDPGPASTAGGARAGGSGSGLVGMRERASALGGSLEAAPTASGGFRVHAELPLPVRAEDEG
ncbi:sensor histidine kinase [Streptacidiphilus jiangxiensis]|uniref:histidine kinase n=1 Tax=Streptacidiphilus jiangxiensis TaxID=235985 RepID=A0A1H7Z8C0_STRJI|nr:histidine kinase [Streptacidiphilus jiangxiensis]SEM53798.1 Signal transduction histidine kinase [Streptacidiphilus jiangxiensis]